MKPISIEHANEFGDFQDVLINMELSEDDKVALHTYHTQDCDKTSYDYDDISMIIYVNVENSKATGINFVAYYPAEQGENEYPTEKLDDKTTESCIDFVASNYIGNEKYYKKY